MRALAGAALLLLPGSCLVPAAHGPQLAGDAAIAATAAMPMAGSADSAPPSNTAQQGGFVLPRKPEQGVVMVAVAPTGTTQLWLDDAPLELAADGHFLLGFDRDAPAQMTLRAQAGDRVLATEYLTIAPAAWRIEHINAPFRGSAEGDPDFARRRPAELAQINAARRLRSDSNGWRQSFIWPVRGRLSGFFGSQRIYQGKPGSYHSGLDIAAPTGTAFVAPADGVVVLSAAAPFTLEGNLLIIDHGMGLTSAFLHASRLDVAAGQLVRQGQQLGGVGATGRATGPHLHWGLRWHRAKLNPLPLLPK